MHLLTAASWFDDTKFTDAYDVGVVFFGQLEPLDYYKIDGAAVKRRILNTAPDVAIPPRRTIKLGEQVYILGDDATDYFQGESVRKRYVMAGADDFVFVKSVEQILSGSTVERVWASVVFNKLESDERVSSVPVPEFQVYFGPLEDVELHDVIMTADAAYWVMSVSRAQSGLIAATVVRLEAETPITITYSSVLYTPLTDSEMDVSADINAVLLRWTEDFTYVSEGTPKYAHGDRTLAVLTADVPDPKLNERVTINGETWRVVNTRRVGAVTNLHIRRG